MKQLLGTLLALPLASPALAQTTNLAIAGTASQSSYYGGSSSVYSEPSNAIDGSRDGVFWNGSSSCTDSQPDSWWRVDLGGRFRLDEIRIFNRSDCCPERLSNFRLSVEDGGVEIWGQDFYVGSGYVPAGGEIVPLVGAPVGDAVQIRILGLNNANNGFLTIAEVEVDGATVGTTYCSPANNNSSGLPGRIEAFGSSKLGTGLDFGLAAYDLPVNQFGYMLCSQTTGSFTPPGSQGLLCLSGQIGRFKAQVQNTDKGGDLGIVVDTAHLPFNPPKAILAGETWHFQAWFRDGGSSNFTDAVTVTFD